MKEKLIPLTQKMIDDIFDDENNEHQSSIVIKLYDIAIPGFSSPDSTIEHVLGWPKVNRETNEYLFGKFRAFDLKNHPNVFPSGLWLNNGFSTDETLESWAISMESCKIEYTQDKLRTLKN
jgi:hypothetical protein